MEENMSQKPERPHHTKRKLRWGRIVGLLVFMVFFFAAFFKITVFVYETFIDPSHGSVHVTAANEEIRSNKKLNERINVLLLGIDDGDSEAAEYEPKRTDAIILLSFDPKENKVSVLSIPRDTRVILPGHRDPDKINAAYAYGGTVMAKQTVANLLQVPIHYYALANWQAFIDVVDLIGGVDIYVDKDMYYEDPYADLVIDIKHGYQHMDGKTAGKYVRFRSDELGDIGRVQRQQKFLKAAAEQMFSIQNMGKVSNLVATLDKHVDTDLNTQTMIKAANSFKIFGDDKVRSCMLYGQFDDSSGISYWAADRESINKSLDELGIPHMEESEDSDNSEQEE